MESEDIYCPENDEYRVYCDKLCIERFHRNHPKSGTLINNIRERH